MYTKSKLHVSMQNGHYREGTVKDKLGIDDAYQFSFSHHRVYNTPSYTSSAHTHTHTHTHTHRRSPGPISAGIRVFRNYLK